MPRRSVRSRRRALGGFLSFAIGALVLAAIALVCAIVLSDRFKPVETDEAVQQMQYGSGDNYVDANDLPESEMVLKSDSFLDEFLPGQLAGTPTPEPEDEVLPTPTPMHTLEPEGSSGSAGGALRPTASGENMLPIFRKANTDKRVIAITLDECSDLKLMTNFVNMARYYNAKLTLFPTGESIMKRGMGALIKSCIQNDGFEVENRGYSDLARIYQYVDGMMVQEIWKQSVALNFVLGVKYKPHFFRMYGGLGENDPRTHAYLKQEGYLGIAHWTTSCTGMDFQDIPGKLTPGGIYAFRCSLEDGQRMYVLLAAAKRAGYRVVTLNQLFGYPSNEITRVQGSLLAETMPAFKYDNTFYNLFPGDCAWAVARLQQRLTDLGYLPEGSSDGIFGEKTSIALRAFQVQINMAASGAADVTTQQRLFSTSAPENTIPLNELFKEEDNPFSSPDDNPFNEPDSGDGASDEPEEEASPETGEDAGGETYRELERGSRGDDVKRLQKALIEAKALTGKADGRYGKKTEKAVSKLQKEWDMEETGVADLAFQERLYGGDASDEAEDSPEDADDATGETGDETGDGEAPGDSEEE